MLFAFYREEGEAFGSRVRRAGGCASVEEELRGKRSAAVVGNFNTGRTGFEASGQHSRSLMPRHRPAEREQKGNRSPKWACAHVPTDLACAGIRIRPRPVWAGQVLGLRGGTGLPEDYGRRRGGARDQRPVSFLGDGRASILQVRGGLLTGHSLNGRCQDGNHAAMA